jgi:hypothetical protein
MPQAHTQNGPRNRVLSFRQWCEKNGFSEATGRRILASGDGPVVFQLSARRIGISEENDRAWLASRARPGVARPGRQGDGGER